MEKKKTMEWDVVNFWELEESWKTEARDNLDNPEEELFLEPKEHHNPREDILWDLSEAYPTNDGYAVIPISNNTALAVVLNDDDTATTWALS